MQLLAATTTLPFTQRAPMPSAIMLPPAALLFLVERMLLLATSPMLLSAATTNPWPAKEHQRLWR